MDYLGFAKRPTTVTPLTIECYINAVSIYWYRVRMKKQSKWFLVGSLMCLGLGSVLQASYGMMNIEEEQETAMMDLPDEIILHIMTFLTPREILNLGKTCKGLQEISNTECLWKQKAVEAGASEVELEKVKKGFFTYKQIVIGHEHWDKFNEIKNLNDVTNEKKTVLLINAAEKGTEKAIRYLLYADLFDNYGVQKDDPEGLVLALKHADLGSEVAIYYLFHYGIHKDDPQGLELAQKYAAKGSRAALCFFRN